MPSVSLWQTCEVRDIVVVESIVRFAEYNANDMKPASALSGQESSPAQTLRINPTEQRKRKNKNQGITVQDLMRPLYRPQRHSASNPARDSAFSTSTEFF